MNLLQDLFRNVNGEDVLTFSMLSGMALVWILYGLKRVRKKKLEFERVERQGGSFLLSKTLMNLGYSSLNPIGDFLIAAGVGPDSLSWSSLLIGALGALALAHGQFGTCGILTGVSALLDSLDGMVARKKGVASDAGEVLDAAVDRYVEFFFLSGAALYYRNEPALLLLCLTAILGSFMVSYSTAKAEALAVSPPRGNMRRPERAFYLVLGAVLTPASASLLEGARPNGFLLGYPMVLALATVSLLSNVSAVQRLSAIARAVAVRDKRPV